jgi:hypothetical protein
MRPDYPNKIFNDKRGNYILLLQSLAKDLVGPPFFFVLP